MIARLRFFLAVVVCLATVRPALAQPAIGADEGRPQVLWQEARQVVGKTAFVAGHVIGVPTAGRITFINFDEQRPVRFAGVIFDDNIANFPKPPAEMYNGKIVRIRGTVSVFRDQPQIIITSPEQVEILDALPGTSRGPAAHRPRQAGATRGRGVQHAQLVRRHRRSLPRGRRHARQAARATSTPGPKH